MQMISLHTSRDSAASPMDRLLTCKQLNTCCCSKHGKVVNDPVHGPLHLEALYLEWIDTMPFQRLRELHQLGLSHFVSVLSPAHYVRQGADSCGLASSSV
jgi:hypothetical protein